jgi:hypothetical protein
MPMKRELYPDDWEEIATRIKDAADWKCQECGVQCYRPGERNDNRRFTLTVAHLNHEPADCRPENLKALCSVCHLQYDAKHRKQERLRKRHAGQANLFPDLQETQD